MSYGFDTYRLMCGCTFIQDLETYEGSNQRLSLYLVCIGLGIQWQVLHVLCVGAVISLPGVGLVYSPLVAGVLHSVPGDLYSNAVCLLVGKDIMRRKIQKYHGTFE